KYIVEASHIDAPRGVRLLFRNCRKQSGEVINRADVVATHQFEDVLWLGAIEVLIDARGRRELRWRHPQIRNHDPIGAVPLPQRRRKLRADLTKRAGDQNASHVPYRTMSADTNGEVRERRFRRRERIRLSDF